MYVTFLMEGVLQQTNEYNLFDKCIAKDWYVQVHNYVHCTYTKNNIHICEKNLLNNYLCNLELCA